MIFLLFLNLFFSDSYRDLPEKPGKDFIQATEKKYSCNVFGVGYKAANDIEGFTFMFTVPQTFSKETARLMAVELVEDLKNRINQYRKMRPYLDHYPFTEKGISITLSFDGGSIQAVRGKVYFDPSDETETYEEAKAIVSKRLPSPSA